MFPTCKHKWSAPSHLHVAHSSGCSQCYNVKRCSPKATHPTLAACSHPLLGEWDYEANAQDGLHPEKIWLQSHKLVHWVCHNVPGGACTRIRPLPTIACWDEVAALVVWVTKLASVFPFSLLPDIAQEWKCEQNEGTPDAYAY